MPVLIPGYRGELKKFKRFKEGVPMTAEVKQVRSNNYHSQFFAVMNFVFHNLPESFQFQHIEQFREWTLYEVGFTEVYKVNGIIKTSARSIKKSEVDEIEFMDRVYNPAFERWQIILGMDRAALIEGSLKMSVDHFYDKG